MPEISRCGERSQTFARRYGAAFAAVGDAAEDALVDTAVLPTSRGPSSSTGRRSSGSSRRVSSPTSRVAEHGAVEFVGVEPVEAAADAAQFAVAVHRLPAAEGGEGDRRGDVLRGATRTSSGVIQAVPSRPHDSGSSKSSSCSFSSRLKWAVSASTARSANDSPRARSNHASGTPGLNARRRPSASKVTNSSLMRQVLRRRISSTSTRLASSSGAKDHFASSSWR